MSPQPNPAPPPTGETTRAGTLEPVLTEAGRRLPDELADAEARLGLTRIGALLPSELADGPLGLELRLAGPKQVDVFAAAVPGSPEFAALQAALGDQRDAAGWSDPCRAAELAETLARWGRREGALPRVARYLLVEIDGPRDAGGAATIAVPSIFLAPRANRDRFVPGQGPNAFQRSPELTTVAAAELAGVWPDPAIAQAFAKVVRAVPSDADVFAVGSMIPRRSGASLRIAIRRLTPDGIRSVLLEAGFPGQAEVLSEIATDCPAPSQAIAFDVGPTAAPRVGLELSPTTNWQLAKTSGWAELVHFVVGMGVAHPARAKRVVDLNDPTGDPLWGLAHIKVAADAGGLLPAAKLYVGLKQAPGRRS